MLTDENDFVVDLFSGSNTTGQVSECLRRKWLSIDLDLEYVASSVFRFSDNEDTASRYFSAIMNGKDLVINGCAMRIGRP